MQERHSFDHRYNIIADAKADGSLGFPINHSGTVISSASKATTEKLAMLEEQVPLDDAMAAEEAKDKQRPPWKIKVNKLLENYYFIGVMSFVTFYALFADDIRLLMMPMEADPVFDALTIVAIIMYLAELILASLVVDGYALSFYFWVDVVSLISMLPDISFIVQSIEGGLGGAGDGADIAKTGRASKVIKIIRIIRLIRLLRVVKLYKQVKTGQKIKNQKIQQQRE